MRTRAIKKMICSKCGASFEIKLSDYRRGRGKYCGRVCSNSDKYGANNPAYKHGAARRTTGQTKEYKAWAGIKDRVQGKNKHSKKYYKDRGITMCLEWFNSFETFFKDMGLVPSAEYSIERINNNGNYEPGNCRWATRREQMNNIRTNKLITFKNQTLTQEEWGRVTALNGTIICKRLRRGWSVEKALTTERMVNQCR